MSIVVGIDIGTTKMVCLVGELDDRRRLQIIGQGIVPSKGIKKGVIVNAEQATEAIQAAVEKAERTSGHEITEAFVGVAGSHVTALNNRASVAINRSDKRVLQEDVRRVLEAARSLAIANAQEIIHVVPRGFWLDGNEGVADPVGLHGYKLEVEAHIVTAGTTTLQTYEKCCEAAGVEIRAFVLEPLASGEAVLTEDEKNLGVVLVDMGGGTTDIAIFMEGSVWHTSSVPVGGSHFTNDLAVGLNCPLPIAEEIKKKYGQSAANQVNDHSPIDVSTFGDEPMGTLTRKEVAEILEHRVAEIFDLIQREVKRSGYDGLLPAGLVFCGGAAQLAGLRDVAKSTFNLPVRVASPQNLMGMVDVLGTPAYATGVGLLAWGMEQHQAEGNPRRRLAGKRLSWLGQVRGWLSRLLPG